jgi:hypothetical protein
VSKPISSTAFESMTTSPLPIENLTTLPVQPLLKMSALRRIYGTAQVHRIVTRKAMLDVTKNNQAVAEPSL